ncbi:venom serine protease [Culex quinquefasciatus]|nr:venom serine protease [Culex quinquefasciatus]
MKSLALALLVITSLLKSSSGQISYAGCDYVYNFESRATGYIQSPNYPNYYAPRTNCRFTIQAPANNYLYAQCYDMYLPSSYGCYYDKLVVSSTGDSTLRDGQARCGSTTFDVASSGNKMVIVLQTSSIYGGRFRCQITAMPPKCNCGTRKTPLIFGGVSTQPNEFPMAAALIDVTSKGLVCGATIITDRHALTASHCLKGRQISKTALLVGDHNMTSGTDTTYAKAMRISTFTMHPSYNEAAKTDDIALVRTVDQIVFNAGVNRACLPFLYSSASFDNVNLEALGWGTLDFGGPMAQDLQKVTLQVMPLGTCRAKLASYGAVQDNQLCTFTAGKDSCQYDSGGPLLYTNPTGNTVYAVGVIDYGIACGLNYPSVSARVASYLGWIEANTVGFTYCEK